MDLYRRSFTRTIQTGERAKLRVDNRNGLILVRVHDSPEVTISVVADIFAASTAEANDDAARIERGITSNGETVDIRTPELPRPEFMFFWRGSRVDYEIAVPRATEAAVSARNGRVELRGVDGPIEVHSRNGPVSLSDIRADVRVEAANGRVSVERCQANVGVASTNGPLSVDRAGGDVTVETRNGSVEVRDALKSVRAATTNGSVRVSGPVNAEMTLETTNGAVRLLVPRAARFEIDAESRRGSVHSDLPLRDSQGDGPRPKVRIRTTNGSIRIGEL